MDLLNQFKEYLFSQTNKASKLTAKNYLSDIRHFIYWFEKFYGESFSPVKISHKNISDYKKSCSDVLSPSSLDRHFSSLRKFFTFLKLDGQLFNSPFDFYPNAGKEKTEIDDWRLKDFKNKLYIYKASHLTIKNYILDIKQFIKWAKEVTGVDDLISTGKINKALIEEYKARLIQNGVYSPATVNRKLSSLRKYIKWAESEGILTQSLASIENVIQVKSSEYIPYIPKIQTKPETNLVNSETKEDNGFFTAPLRLVKSVTTVALTALDLILISHIVKSTNKLKYFFWNLKGQPVFVKNPHSLVTKTITAQDLLGIKNISKAIYAPFDISTSGLSPAQRLIHHIRYTRPNWYKRYHSYTFTHYLHFAILIIFLSAMGFGLYNEFFLKPTKNNPALAYSVPPRILSFQGRLTDDDDNPITTGTNLRFGIYNDSTASGSAFLWEELDYVTPDTDGIFNVILGANNSIPQSVFANNNNLWLGVSVDTTPELTPRQRIATVGFAANSDTLQGLPPITQSGAGTTNVVLALDSSGNLTIGGSANPIFQSTGGQFTLSGQALLLTTNVGTNTNISMSPDGVGVIDLQKPLMNTSNNNNIVTAVGSVEVDDLFSVLATSSAQSAFTINQDGGGPIISASASGVEKFTIDSSGNQILAGNLDVAGTLTSGTSDAFTVNSLGNITTTGTTFTASSLTTITTAATLGMSSTTTLDLGSNFTVNSAATALNLQTDGSINVNIAGGSSSSGCTIVNSTGDLTCSGNIVGAATGTQGHWDIANGSLYPRLASTLDLLIGGTSTSSADFAVLNVDGSGPAIATVSGNLIVMPKDGAGGKIGIGTDNPTEKLSIAGEGFVIASVTSTDGTSANFLVNADDPSKAAASLTAGGNSNFLFSDNANFYIQARSKANVIAGSGDPNSSKLTILGSNSNVGVGTITPASELHVTRPLSFGTNGTALVIFDQIEDQDIFTASYGGTTQFVIENDGDIRIPNGNVGIGIDPSTSYKLYSYGQGTDTTSKSTSRTLMQTVCTSVACSGAYRAGEFTAENHPNSTQDISGTINAIFSDVNNLDTGTVGAAYNIMIDDIANSGTIDNTYGLYIGDLTAGTQTNTPFSIYASDSSAHNYFAGNVGIGTSTPTTFKLEVGGSVGPSVGSAYDLGSSAKRWANVYGDTGNFTNLVGTVVGGSTISDDWLINSDNATVDTEDSTLSFDRGTPGTNTQFKWNSTTKQLTTNSPSFAILPDPSISFSGTSALIVNQVQNQDIFTASAAGETRFTVANDGSFTSASFASISGNLTLAGAPRSIQTTEGNTLTLGGNTSGLVQVNNKSGSAFTTFDTVNSFVGIGTSTPNRTLHLVSTADGINSGIRISASDISVNNGYLIINKDSGVGTAATLQSGDTYNAAPIALNPLGGNVGVGTTSPTALLDVAGAASVGGQLKFRSGSGTIQTTANESLIIGGDTTGNIVLSPLNSIAGSKVLPGADNLVSLGATSTARFKDIFLGPGSVHIQCTTGDGCGQELDYALGINTATGTFSIGVNGDTATGNPIINISQGGNVGIGVTGPTAKLHLVDQNNAGWRYEQYNNGDGTNFRNYRARGTIDSPSAVINGDRLASFLGAGRGDTTWSAPNGGISIWAAETFTDSAAGTYVTIGTSALGTNPAGGGLERLRIDSNGLLGLGTTTPASQFHLTRALTVDVTGKALAIFDQIENQDIFTASAGGTPKFVIQNDGDVGIGTTSPGALLHVANETTGGITIGNYNSSTKAITFRNLNTSAANQIFTISGAQNDFIFSKPVATAADITRYDFTSVGSLNSVNPFWAGIHMTTPDIITENGANTFPRTSFFHNYATTADPTDMYFNIQTGNAGTLNYGIKLTTQGNGDINFNPQGNGSTEVGATGLNGLFNVNGSRTLAQGQALVQINQTSTGPIFTASTSGSAKFTIENNGYVKLTGTRPVIFTQGDNGTTHVGGISFLTNDNGVTNIWTPTDEAGTTVDSTIRLGGFGSFNSNEVNLATTGNLLVGATSESIADTGFVPNGDDAYIEGDLGINGTFYLDGNIDTTLTQGSVVFAGSGGVLSQDNSNFFFDDSTDELGIGTAAPDQELHIYGTTNDDARLRLTGNNAVIELQDQDNASRISYFYQNNTGDMIMTPYSQQVGIGTAAPGRILEVYANNTSDNLFKVNNAGQGYATTLYTAGTSQMYVGQAADTVNWASTGVGSGIVQTTGNLILASPLNTPRVTILSSSGNVGIGTTAPYARLTSSAAASDPASGIDSFALTATGSYGGGIGLQDGTGNFGIWTDTTGTNARFGFGTSLGALSTYMTLSSSALTLVGDLAVNGDDITSDGDLTINPAGDDILLSGDRINWQATGVAAPTFTSYSAGVKQVFWNSLSGSNSGFTLGVESSTLFFTVGTTAEQYKWYGGTTQAMLLSGTGNLTITGDLAITGGNITTAVTADSSLTVTGTFDPNGAVTLPTTGISGAGSGSGLNADQLDGYDQSVFGGYVSGVTDIHAVGGQNLYTFFSSAATPANSPAGGTWVQGIQFPLAGNSTYRQLLATDGNTGNLYFESQGGGVWGGWRKIWDAGNDGSGSTLDADLLDGQNLDTAATGNTVMGRDANGDSNVRYLNSSYLNMSHAASGATTDTVFYSSTDNYIRKNTAAGFRSSVGLAAGGAGDIWVEKAGDTMTGALTNTLASGNSLIWDTSTLIVDATNNRVGVGTTTPNAALTVSGGGTFTNNHNIYGSDTTREGLNINSYDLGQPNTWQRVSDIVAGQGNTASEIRFLTADWWTYSPVARMVILPSGFVGIGAATPSGKLHVQSSTDTELRVDSTSSTNDPILRLTDANGPTAEGLKLWYDSSVGDVYFDSMYNAATGDIHFRTKTAGTPVDALFIESAGNVGIGTTAPLNKLQTVGVAQFNLAATGIETLSSGATVEINNASGTNTWYAFRTAGNAGGGIGVKTGDTNVYISNTYAAWTDFGVANRSITLSNGGNVGIGTTTPNASARMSILNGDNSMIYFGPNTSWAGALYVGAGTSKITTNTAQVISTDGNLHLDPGTSKDTYINFYNNTRPIHMYGAIDTSSSLTVAGTFDPNGAVTLPTTGISGAGSGSGLDADLIDGINSANIVYGTNGQAVSYQTASDMNTLNLRSGFYSYNTPTNSPTGAWTNWIQFTGHVTGDNYGFQIANSYWDADPYFRHIQTNGFGAWYKMWHAGNDGSGSTLDADLLDGQNLTTAATGSTVMGRDGNGDTNVRYLFSTYLNMSHAASGATTDTIFYSSYDNYIRKNTATGFMSSLGVGTEDSPTFTGLTITGGASFTADGGNLSVGCSGVACWTNSNGIIGFPGSGTQHSQIAFYPGSGIAFLNSSATSPAADQGALASATKVNIYAAALDTGQGVYELYAMNQNVQTSNAVSFAGITSTSGLTVGNASNTYSYLYMADDESTTGYKSIHANSNVIGFLNGAGGWQVYWDHSGNQQTSGGITATTINTGLGAFELYAMNQNVQTTDNPTFGTIYTSNWFRSSGNSGWYSSDYGGGIWMTDASYVRTYNSKPMAANAYYDQDDTAYYANPNGFSQMGSMDMNSYFTSTYNMAGSLTGVVSSGLTIGWNYTSGQGETDFFNGQGGGTNGGFRFYTNGGTLLMELRQNGYLVMPSLSSGAGDRSVCYATGTSIVSINNGACGTSSLRYKHDIENLSYGLDAINSLRPVSFIYNDFDPNNPDGRTERRLGFVAEEMDQIIPEVVMYDEQGRPNGIDYAYLTSVAIKGIQEQQLQIASHSASITNINKDLSLSYFGDVSIYASPSADPIFQAVRFENNEVVNRIGAFSELIVAKIKVGLINTQKISTSALTVTGENMLIGGETIRNYITSIVNDVISNSELLISTQIANLNTQNLISPIASIDVLKTNLISPLGDEAEVAIKVEKDKISILNDDNASASAVAVFDNTGNASFAGQLTSDSLATNNISSQELQVSSDASVSGTLRASRIIADQIDLSKEALTKLEEQIATPSANYITNNYYTTNNESDFPTLNTGSDSSSGEFGIFSYLFESKNYVNIATLSSQLAYVENLNASFATFSNGLMVYGPTTLSDTSIVGQLSVNGSLILANNSINTLGNDLSLQPLRQGGLSIMGGLIYIDTNGNIKFGSDATVEGTLYVNNIAPLPNRDLTLNLASSSANSRFVVKGASGSAVLALDNLGNLIASGGASLAKLNINSIVGPALAVSQTELIATGSAGVAKINQYKKEMTIKNSLVTQNSLIYITPTSNTGNQVLYLIRQEPEQLQTSEVEGSFTVGIQGPTTVEIPFNWIIIN